MSSKPQRSVKSSASKQTTSLLFNEKIPSVWFSDKAWSQLWIIIEMCPKEVGWFGTVDRLEDGDYLIDQLYVPEQTVTGTETDISAEALGTLANDLERQGIDSTRLRYWGHSHVNMVVTPSSTDENQVSEYLDNVDWFIRGIHNKKGESKVDVYDVEENLLYQCVDVGRVPFALPQEDLVKLLRDINTNVEERAYPVQVVNSYPRRYNSYGGYHVDDRDPHQGYTKPAVRPEKTQESFAEQAYWDAYTQAPWEYN